MIKELVKEEFTADLSEGSVLVDFYSKTCGPCKMLSFILKELIKNSVIKQRLLKLILKKIPT